jgi:dipeptide/tripeptide permease
MAHEQYRTAPLPSSRLPGGIPYIVGNEAAERFSFYGMKAILYVFMTQQLRDAEGQFDLMTDEQAKTWLHMFVFATYFFPILGAVISDAFLGKYRTIIWLSLVYCAGHLALALDETRLGLMVGLSLIALGAGGIKPCVSAHVGDQFGKENQHLLSKVFGWFYFSINLGAFLSTMLTPVLLEVHGPHVAFGVPGILMGLATLLFWLGRHKFVHVPAGGIGSVKEAFSGDGLLAIRNLAMIYVFVAVFWSLFDQTASAWVQQAVRMDRFWMGKEWLPSQIQAVNPILILLFIPLFSYALYPAIDRLFPLTPLRKIGMGFFLAAASFSVSAWIQSEITGGEVLKATSEQDSKDRAAANVIDGHGAARGWQSKHAPKFPHEIVLRLREGRAWTISSAHFFPPLDRGQIAASAPREVEVLVGNSRFGPWNSVGRMTLDRDVPVHELHFPPVEAGFVTIRILSNWGGDFVALEEVEIHAHDSLPADAHRYAAAVWPNVAAAGYQPNIGWQLFAYVLLTAAEIMVSITCLEFSYTQAPNKLKSFIMSLYLLSVAAGNAFTAGVNFLIENKDGSSKLEGADYYWFFTIIMFVTALAFILVAKTYRGRTYIQAEREV